MTDKIDELIENLDSDAREYDPLECSLPIWSPISMENMKESIKNYSRHLLWHLAAHYGQTAGSIPDIDDVVSTFIDEQQLNAKE